MPTTGQPSIDGLRSQMLGQLGWGRFQPALTGVRQTRVDEHEAECPIERCPRYSQEGTCASMAAQAHLSQRLASNDVTGPYQKRVMTYGDPHFEELTGRLEDLLDEHAKDKPDVRAAYRRAMQLEIDFFTAAAAG